MNAARMERPGIYEKPNFVFSNVIYFIYTLSIPTLGRTTSPFLAKRFNISHSYLCRKFQIKLTLTPSKFLFRVKMLRVFNLLDSIDSHTLSIADISMKIGFEEVDYFSRLFKEYWGMAPGRFRSFAQSMSSEKIQKSQSGKHENVKSLFLTIIYYIHSLPNPILGRTTVQILAKKFDISVSSLSQTFRATFSCSPGVYLKRVKMLRAFNLLESPFSDALTISEISLLFDFKDVEYFSKIFREYWGMTPGKVRWTAKILSLETRRDYQWLPLAQKRNQLRRRKMFNSICANIIEYILNIDNLALGQLTVEIIAFKFKISKSHLYGYFSRAENFPLSLADILVIKKMVRAFKLLSSVESHSLAIKDISLIFGFSRCDYFIGIFKKFWGVTPGRVKKESISALPGNRKVKVLNFKKDQNTVGPKISFSKNFRDKVKFTAIRPGWTNLTHFDEDRIQIIEQVKKMRAAREA